MKWIAVIFIVYLLGCKPSEAVKRSRALKFYTEHPAEFAKNCADAFPVKDSVGDDYVDSTLLADNMDLSQWLRNTYTELENLREKVDADTSAIVRRYTDQINVLVNRVRDLNAKYKPCEPVYKIRPVYKENTARVAALTLQIDSLRQDGVVSKEREKQALKRAEIAENKAKHRLIGLIGAVIGAIALIILRIKNIL